MTEKELHDRKLEEAANSYRTKGYRVVVEPAPQQLPDFLAGMEPDIVATKPDDRVIIEVKNKRALRSSDIHRRIADRIANQPGWRFELILFSSEGDIPSIEEFSSLNETEIEGLVQEAKSTLDPKIAFMIAWVAAEAALRLVAASYALPSTTLSPKLLLKELRFAGAISPEQYEVINDSFSVRNRVIHGFREDNLTLEDIDKLITAVSSLLVEAKAAMPSSV